MSTTSQAGPWSAVAKESPEPHTASGSSVKTGGNSSVGGSSSNGVTPCAKPSALTFMSRSTKRRQATSVRAGMRALPAVPKFRTSGGPVLWFRRRARYRVSVIAALTLPTPVKRTSTPAPSKTPAASAGSAIATRSAGASAAIADDRARRGAAAAEVLRDAEVDQDPGVEHVEARVRRELGGGRERAAGRQHVVDEDEPALAALHFEHAGGVFERVVALDHGRWELALLADRHEALAAALGERGGEDEPARLDAGDRVGRRPFARAEQAVERLDGLGEVRAQERRYVAEQDARLREVRHVDDQSGKRMHGFLAGSGAARRFGGVDVDEVRHLGDRAVAFREAPDRREDVRHVVPDRDPRIGRLRRVAQRVVEEDLGAAHVQHRRRQARGAPEQRRD